MYRLFPDGFSTFCFFAGEDVSSVAWACFLGFRLDFLGFEGTSLSSSVRLRFVDFPLTISFPNHDDFSVVSTSSVGIALLSSFSGPSLLSPLFPRKARAFFFRLESFSTITEKFLCRFSNLIYTQQPSKVQTLNYVQDIVYQAIIILRIFPFLGLPYSSSPSLSFDWFNHPNSSKQLPRQISLRNTKNRHLSPTTPFNQTLSIISITKCSGENRWRSICTSPSSIAFLPA
jgi:hypothetical protein